MLNIFESCWWVWEIAKFWLLYENKFLEIAQSYFSKQVVPYFKAMPNYIE